MSKGFSLNRIVLRLESAKRSGPWSDDLEAALEDARRTRDWLLLTGELEKARMEGHFDGALGVSAAVVPVSVLDLISHAVDGHHA